MDTLNHPPFFISPDVLAARRGHADALLLLDVRRKARFLQSPRMPLCDALYAWCRSAQGEPHSWKLETMIAAAA